MKIKALKKYRGEEDYFDVSYNKIIDELTLALQNLGLLMEEIKALQFTENFDCFESETQTVTAGTEVAIRHPFAAVPSYWIIVRRTGNTVIADGPTAWTDEFIYLQNVGANTATFKVLIFK